MDVRTSCSGNEKGEIEEAVWGIRNELLHESLLTTDDSPWGVVRHYPPKPAKVGRSKEEEAEVFKIGFPTPTFDDLQLYAYKILWAIAEAFDELREVEFLQEQAQES